MELPDQKVLSGYRWLLPRSAVADDGEGDRLGQLCGMGRSLLYHALLPESLLGLQGFGYDDDPQVMNGRLTWGFMGKDK